MINDKGFMNHSVANNKAVGEQGVSSKNQGGSKVKNVSNPRGVEPKSHGSKAIPLGPQDGVKPAVGK